MCECVLSQKICQPSWQIYSTNCQTTGFWWRLTSLSTLWHLVSVLFIDHCTARTILLSTTECSTSTISGRCATVLCLIWTIRAVRCSGATFLYSVVHDVLRCSILRSMIRRNELLIVKWVCVQFRVRGACPMLMLGITCCRFRRNELCFLLLLNLRVTVIFLGIQVLFISDAGPSFFRRGACEGLTLGREEIVSGKSYALVKWTDNGFGGFILSSDIYLVMF